MNSAKQAAFHKHGGTPSRKRPPIPRRKGWARIRYLAINVFLVAHLVAITCWAVPFSNPLIAMCRDLVRPYFQWAGLFQSWDMFSPVPKLANSYMEALVIYEDGNTRNWKFPRMELLNWKDRYSKERYRKFVEILQDEKNAAYWPDAARFIARVNNDRPVHVKMVLLIRYWSAINPRPAGAAVNGSYKPAPWDEHVFYALPITPGDLE
jgi:hypothetical protein